MTTLNSIGLDIEKSKRLAEKLNELLADYSVFYQNIRGYHWNIKGDKFFELHDKFQELYENLFVKLDEVAERSRPWVTHLFINIQLSKGSKNKRKYRSV